MPKTPWHVAQYSSPSSARTDSEEWLSARASPHTPPQYVRNSWNVLSANLQVVAAECLSGTPRLSFVSYRRRMP